MEVKLCVNLEVCFNIVNTTFLSLNLRDSITVSSVQNAWDYVSNSNFFNISSFDLNKIVEKRTTSFLFKMHNFIAQDISTTGRLLRFLREITVDSAFWYSIADDVEATPMLPIACLFL